jgi:hypothetical protein
MRTKGLKVQRRRFCEVCRNTDGKHEPIWAMQHIMDIVPSFYRLGSHIRGFGLVRICDECRERLGEQSKLIEGK